jgi:hypothetical protein
MAMPKLNVKSVTNACLLLSKNLDANNDIRDQILCFIPKGNKCNQLLWLQQHIKKPFKLAIIAAFPKNQIMAKTHIATKWTALLARIFPENAAAVVRKRKNEKKRRQ